jgi:hypothetical protein
MQESEALSDDTAQKRAWVMDLYPGPGWKAKVEKMSDAQVIAIYLRESSKPPKNDKPKESGESDIPF